MYMPTKQAEFEESNIPLWDHEISSSDVNGLVFKEVLENKKKT